MNFDLTFDPYDGETLADIDERGASLYLGDLKPAKASLSLDLAEVPYTSGSDYSGGSIEVANKRAFLEDYGNRAGVYETYGGYSSYGVVITRACLAANPDIRETIKSLEDYPLIDEELHSLVEMEAEDEAWESWAASDFERLLDPDMDKDYPEDRIRELFDNAREVANVYWENEQGNNAYIDLERVAKHVPIWG